jgi:hypothetical protein
MDRSDSIELSSSAVGAHKRKSLSSSDVELEKGDGSQDLNRTTTTGEVVRAGASSSSPCSCPNTRLVNPLWRRRAPS